jgi:hypothetical protein
MNARCANESHASVQYDDSRQDAALPSLMETASPTTSRVRVARNPDNRDGITRWGIPEEA